jgi:UDP-N-acetyl-D-mannosaminuronate dehydrogenase
LADIVLVLIPGYLAKAQEPGYHPEIILAGRRLNDSMAEYVASQNKLNDYQKKELLFIVLIY